MNILFISLLLNFMSIQDTVERLDHLKWKNRLVLYFPQNKKSRFDFSDSLKAEIQERKVAYFIFQGKDIVSNLPIRFSDSYQESILKRYKMGSKTDCLVLIGLDGGVKLKKELGLDWKLILKAIDSMPMRASEIKDN
ncbi:hypothetical protein Belba_3191 [Belliella baltica DSM 15883]|uniref:DUF4174 domain-containing protein n=1 Tax=Belliella baltica (strain DSM 15883 / CIP 108006 / LMG 21964 / BA134) TaxID=866536 RepID=I3Z8Y5_BELBD|nr:DUF4174 domain-containing protein [Belliella baltica]AFL85703.1 hypothetical protein Belba_3191 [Belliella baltica DSM 15883]